MRIVNIRKVKNAIKYVIGCWDGDGIQKFGILVTVGVCGGEKVVVLDMHCIPSFLDFFLKKNQGLSLILGQFSQKKLVHTKGQHIF